MFGALLFYKSKMFNSTYWYNLVNSNSWSDKDWLNFVQERLQKMKSARWEFDKKFDDNEKTEAFISYYDNEWNLEVVVPLIQNLIEIYMGRTNWKVSYDIQPDWQADIEELQPAKYALNFFLDWNLNSNFWIENKLFRQYKAVYGTWVYFTWLRSERYLTYQFKEWVEITEDILQDRKAMEEVFIKNWLFYPKAIHPKDFYIDNWAYSTPNFSNANDCIWKEKLSLVDFENRFKNKKWIDKDVYDVIIWWTDPNPINRYDNTKSEDYVLLYHYHDKVKQNYIILVNEDYILYRWYNFYNDWKLPFVLAQHFTDPNCIRWRWYPDRIGYLKAYKSEMLSDILIWANNASATNLLVWDWAEIWDWQTGWRWVNIWSTTTWAERVQQINTTPNLWYFTTILQIIDDLVVQDTWDNPRAPFQAESDKVWIVEVMEANKAVRQSSVDENYNIALDQALTMTLQRIKDFAPSLLSKTIKDSDWKVLKKVFPKITIQWYEVKKEDWKQVFNENLSKIWYFELKPWVVQWLWVKITTSSTNSMLPILERERVKEYINNIVQLTQLAQIDPTVAPKITEFLRIDELLGWMSDAYGYDNKLKANTEKDKITIENKKKIAKLQAQLKSINTNNVNPNENPNETMAQVPWVMEQAQGGAGAMQGWTPTM